MLFHKKLVINFVPFWVHGQLFPSFKYRSCWFDWITQLRFMNIDILRAPKDTICSHKISSVRKPFVENIKVLNCDSAMFGTTTAFPLSKYRDWIKYMRSNCPKNDWFVRRCFCQFWLFVFFQQSLKLVCQNPLESSTKIWSLIFSSAQKWSL